MNFPFTFKFHTSDTIIEITFDSIISLIVGDSGTGKTYIAKYIKNYSQTETLKEYVKCNWDLNKLYVCLNKNDIEDIYSKEGHIIIIDRFDMYANDKLIDFINTCKNMFVIMYRGSNTKLKARLDDMYILCNKTSNGLDYFYTSNIYAGDNLKYI